jgi:hypothetical protein
MKQQANQPSWRSTPYASRVAALAIVGACLVFALSMWIFRDLFKDATTVIAALGSLLQDTAQQALAELDPDVARKIVQGR